MNAVPMVARCLELQNDLIPPPLEALPRGVEEHAFPTSWNVSTFCSRPTCQCDHGAPLLVEPVAYG